MPEVRVLHAHPVGADEQQQEERFGEEQEAPALADERDDLVPPMPTGGDADEHHDAERSRDLVAGVIHRAVARREVGEIREAEHAERFRQHEASVGEAAEDDDGKRDERERRDLHREQPEEHRMVVDDVAGVEDAAPRAAPLLFLRDRRSEFDAVLAKILRKRRDAGNEGIGAEYLACAVRRIGVGLLVDDDLRMVVDGERLLGGAVVECDAKD